MLTLDYWRSARPEDLFAAVAEEENRDFVARTMRRLAWDRQTTDVILDFVSSGRIETRCFVSWLARS